MISLFLGIFLIIWTIIGLFVYYSQEDNLRSASFKKKIIFTLLCGPGPIGGMILEFIIFFSIDLWKRSYNTIKNWLTD